MFKFKFKMVALLPCVGALLLPVLSHGADDSPKWGAVEKAVRTPVTGGSGYYDAEKIERDGDVIRFKVYASVEMSDSRVIDEVAINCETHEMARVKSVSAAGKSEWEAPAKLFAGEGMYATARELCKWGPGFWKRLAD